MSVHREQQYLLLDYMGRGQCLLVGSAHAGGALDDARGAARSCERALSCAVPCESSEQCCERVGGELGLLTVTPCSPMASGTCSDVSHLPPPPPVPRRSNSPTDSSSCSSSTFSSPRRVPGCVPISRTSQGRGAALPPRQGETHSGLPSQTSRFILVERSKPPRRGGTRSRLPSPASPFTSDDE
jgi:hypothetical protein